MSEKCTHKPSIRCAEFLKQYFKKDGILMQTFHCRQCGEDIHFMKKNAYKLWDALIWLILLAFMLGMRMAKDMATATMALWLYILIAVVAISLLGLGLDMAKEWLLLKAGHFQLASAKATGTNKDEKTSAK